MLWETRKRWLPAICALGLLSGGCDLLNRSTGDEEREPHYVRGLNWQIQGQTGKAIESFTHSLQSNPNSAAAHLALGDLHYKQTKNFIVAAYHYTEYLRLKSARQPGFRDQGVEDLFRNCELQIAAKYADSVGRREQQTALDDLRTRVANLQDENRTLRRMAGIESLRTTVTNPPPALPVRTNAVPPSNRPGPVAETIRQPATPVNAQPNARTHKVAPNETPSGIARRYGISTKALLAANPSLKPTQMRVGQLLNIPAQ